MDVGAVVTPPHGAGSLQLVPFRGLTLAPRRIGGLASVRAFTRPYRGVPDRLDRWERRGQLTHDDRPAVYLHEYTAGGITVRGLVGGLDLSCRARSREEVAVLPHEGIHPAQVDELAARMVEMQINPAPILLVHRGSADTRELLGEVQARPPQLAFVDRAQQQHRIWALRAEEELARIDAALRDTRALIADGHHRYAAYLRLQELQPGPATDSGLAMLVDQDDTPLFLGAIHRLLGGVTITGLQEAAQRVGASFEATDSRRGVAALAPDTVVASDGTRWATLRPARGPARGPAIGPDRAVVEWLHQDLVPALPRPPTSTSYLHAVDEALAAVRRRRGVALLMPAPDVSQVLGIAAADRLLPEKATSFQPKPSVGVLIRSLRDG
ncbi:DUF1015 family protein [Nocardioides sp.]|uniref:DUF1015 family protein n=1 Tax=Nocardioides sp. TaxID=35761 RepID=UPI0026343258|nr:DUF1015 family protein [Nocardioides sp.]MDI6912418.1 DUF1015 family protein [Nocardioides sp.]